MASVGPVTLLWRPLRTSPCLASFGRVKTGMSRGDVTARLGAPPVRVTVPQDELFGVRAWEEWVGPDGDCVVGFGSDGRVHYCRVNSRPVPDKPLWQRARNRPPSCPGTLRPLR